MIGDMQISHHLWSFQSHIFFALIVDDLCMVYHGTYNPNGFFYTNPHNVPQIFCIDCWYISLLHFVLTSKLGHIGDSNGSLIFCTPKHKGMAIF